MVYKKLSLDRLETTFEICKKKKKKTFEIDAPSSLINEYVSIRFGNYISWVIDLKSLY